MSLLNKLSISLALYDETKGLYLSKDLSIVRDPAKKAGSSDEIIRSVVHVASNALSSETVDTLKTCDKLRKAVDAFKGKHPDLSKNLVDKVNCIISLLFLKAFPVDKESFLTKELSLSEDVANKMSLADFVDAVSRYVQEFIRLPFADLDLDCIPKELFLHFNKNLESFCESDKRALWFNNQLLPLAWGRWNLERNMIVARQGFDSDQESIEGEKLLLKSIKKPSRDDFKLLSHPRDVLFVEKKVYITLKTLALAKFETAKKINRWTKSGAEIIFEEVREGVKAYFLEMKDATLDTEQQQIQTQVNLACVNLHKTGPNAFTQSTIEKLITYRDNNKDRTLFCQRLLDQLAINELMYKHRQANEEWINLDLPIGALHNIHKGTATFDKRSYAPYIRLKFLRALGRVLRKNTIAIESRKKPTKPMFANQEKKAKLFLDAFDLIEAKVLDSEEETFYGIVSEKIRTMAMADKKKTQRNLKLYQRLKFIEGTVGESDYKEYIFEEPTKSAYEAQLKSIKEIKEMLPLAIEKMVERALKPVVKAEVAKPLEDIPEFLNAPKKLPVRRKRTKVKPVLSDKNNSENIEALSDRLSKIAINTESSSKKTLSTILQSKPIIKQLAPVLPSKSSIQYHDRVLRWWKYLPISHKHPFNSDSKYLTMVPPLGPDVKSRIHVEHSLSPLTDRFLDRSIRETREDKLAEYGVTERVDIVTQIETLASDGSTIKRNGVIVCSFADIKDKKVNIHRSFTDLAHEMVDFSKAEAGWQKINQAVAIDSGMKIKRGRHYVQDDGSYLESIKDDIVTIVDPKNSTTIRIALQ